MCVCVMGKRAGGLLFRACGDDGSMPTIGSSWFVEAATLGERGGRSSTSCARESVGGGAHTHDSQSVDPFSPSSRNPSRTPGTTCQGAQSIDRRAGANSTAAVVPNYSVTNRDTGGSCIATGPATINYERQQRSNVKRAGEKFGELRRVGIHPPSPEKNNYVRGCMHG